MNAACHSDVGGSKVQRMLSARPCRVSLSQASNLPAAPPTSDPAAETTAERASLRAEFRMKSFGTFSLKRRQRPAENLL